MAEESGFLVSSSPHVRGEADTRSIMLDVIISLVPAVVAAVYYFRVRALILVLVSVFSCLLFEGLYRALMHKPSSLRDLSAAVTGLLLAFCLPVTVPYWVPVVGAFFAIVVVKQLYGGLGHNFVNPALAARVFLFSWPVHLTTWARPFAQIPLWTSGASGIPDAMTTATPLAYLRRGVLPDAEVSLLQMLLGERGGSLGETSALILLLGGVYLLTRRVLALRIPAAFLGTVAVLSVLTVPAGQARTDWVLFQLLSGGLILGAVFMATDYVTSPVTPMGQWFYGIGCGLLTVLIRSFGAYPEGVSFAILVMNACVWIFDKAGMPRRFGARFFPLRKNAAPPGSPAKGVEP